MIKILEIGSSLGNSKNSMKIANSVLEKGNSIGSDENNICT
jgi:hypothetical protein